MSKLAISKLEKYLPATFIRWNDEISEKISNTD
jgi:hypothetical protein